MINNINNSSLWKTKVNFFYATKFFPSLKTDLIFFNKLYSHVKVWVFFVPFNQSKPHYFCFSPIFLYLFIIHIALLLTQNHEYTLIRFSFLYFSLLFLVPFCSFFFDVEVHARLTGKIRKIVVCNSDLFFFLHVPSSFFLHILAPGTKGVFILIS